MTSREHYRAVMHRQPGVRTLLWEFGYWTATVERWYGEGLPSSPFMPPMGLPPGNGVFGEALPFPHMPGLVRYRDLDIHRQVGHDDGAIRIPVNWRHSPAFGERILEEDADTRVMINGDGVKVRVNKGNDSLPQYLEFPVYDRASWETIKSERFGPDIAKRFPDRWQNMLPAFRRRDYPLGLVMDGFFSAPRELLGVENQLMMYYDDPELMHDINDHLANTWLAAVEEVVSQVDIDFVYVWEDMSFKNGPLMSPAAFRTFIVPYYKRVTSFLRAHGIDVIFVDTDGYCMELIPGFIDGGVTGMYPFECQAGMDIVEVRKRFPQLLIQGGLDKTKVAAGPETIDAELAAKLPVLLAQGGYIPYCDHLVPPDVSWENYTYLRKRIQEYVGEYQPM
jgi:uroporphyrinogen decarboxylase